MNENLSESYIHIQQLNLLGNQINWNIGKGELNAIIGPNKSGKSLFAKIICGKVFNYQGTVHKNVAAQDISFSDYSADSSSFHYSNFYYQQRYNVSDAPNIETIQEYLNYDENNAYQNDIFKRLLTASILSKTLIELSSGESRKVLILKNIFKPCKLYLLDNPFTGLDKDSVLGISDVFKIMTQQYNKTVILLMNASRAEIIFDNVIRLKMPDVTISNQQPLSYSGIYKTADTSYNIAFQIKDQTINVGNTLLLHNVTWEIRRGEKWLLKGENGSGKSTLMSLLNADNPIAYKLGITLFDKKRGTGESIWEIKSKIGFVSPEIQLFWDATMLVKNVLRSGFSNTLVLNRKLSLQEKRQYEILIDAFQLRSIENSLFSTLSSGEKRIVMVVRALVNNPPLLILDEPFQGLDQERFTLLYNFLSKYVDEDRTLVQIAHFEKEILPCINKSAQITNRQLYIENH